MRQRKSLFLIGLSVLLCLPCALTFGQLRGGTGRARVGGARIGAGGARVPSSPRSGLDFRSNPIANPAPSLTTHEVLNPRGSLSAGQVLNPAPSLRRPRSGQSLPGTNMGKPTTAMRYQSARPSPAEDTVLPETAAAPRTVTAGEKVLESVVALDAQLAKTAPDKGWLKRLSLDELRAVPVFSEQPADDSQRTALENILKVFQTVAKEEQSATINELPEFKDTLETLHEYLSPIHPRRRRQAAAAFQQLANELGSYKNGASWVEYLVPTKLTTNNDEIPVSSEQAEKLLKRFDKLAGDPDYNKVTSLPGFEPARDALRATVGQSTP